MQHLLSFIEDDQHWLYQEIAKRLFSRLDFLKIIPEHVLLLNSYRAELPNQLHTRYPKATIWQHHAIHTPSIMTKTNVFLKKQTVVQPIVCTHSAMPFANNSIQLVVGNLLLHTQDAFRTFMQQVHSLLAPQGICLFTTLGAGTRLPEIAMSTITEDMHNIGDCLHQTGFKDPVMDMEQLSIEYPSLDSLAKELYAAEIKNTPDDQKPSQAQLELIYGHVLGTPAYQTPKIELTIVE